MNLSTDQNVLFQLGIFSINETIVTTWIIIIAMTLAAKLITRRVAGELTVSRWQLVLEIVILAIANQIKEVGLEKPRNYIGFLGTLFLFLAVCSVLTMVPGYSPPTGSLSTTAALAFCVFVAVPFFGIVEQGLGGYFKSYTEPTVIMLPFNIISEVSRTLALAIRLFGNMMSGTMIIAILLTITPLLFPVLMTLLGLLSGMVQAYIFTILAAVYIAAATRTQKQKNKVDLGKGRPHG